MSTKNPSLSIPSITGVIAIVISALALTRDCGSKTAEAAADYGALKQQLTDIKEYLTKRDASDDQWKRRMEDKVDSLNGCTGKKE